jgi:hypothetical protein
MGEFDEPVVRDSESLFSAPTTQARMSHGSGPRGAGRRFAAPLERSGKCYAQQEAKEIEALKLPDMADEMLDPTQRESAIITGRQRYALARKALRSYGINGSAMQQLFWNHMFGACAQLLFKDDLEANRDDFMLELGLTRLQPQFMAITPRRFGKTYSVAMFVVAMAFAVGGLEQAIFSTGRRASQKLLDLIYAFICKIPGMKEKIIKHNVETIEIQGPLGPSDIRKISSYPSKVKVSRCARVADASVSSSVPRSRRVRTPTHSCQVSGYAIERASGYY